MGGFERLLLDAAMTAHKRPQRQCQHDDEDGGEQPDKEPQQKCDSAGLRSAGIDGGLLMTGAAGEGESGRCERPATKRKRLRRWTWDGAGRGRPPRTLRSAPQGAFIS